MRRLFGFSFALILSSAPLSAQIDTWAVRGAQIDTFAIRERGILRLQPGEVIALRASDGVYTFANGGTVLVIQKDTAWVAELRTFAPRILPPTAPPLFTQGPLSIVFVYRARTTDGGGYLFLVGLLYRSYPPRPGA